MSNDVESGVIKSRQNFYVIFVSAFIFCLLLVNAVFSSQWISDLSSKHWSVNNTGRVLIALKNLHQAVLAVESGQRGYLLTGDERYLEYYNLTLDDLQNRLDAVRELSTEVPGQSDKVKALLELTERKVSELKKTVDLAKANFEPAAIKMILTGRGRNLYQLLAESFAEVEQAEFNLQARLYADLAVVEKNGRLAYAASLLTSILLTIALVFAWRRMQRRDFEYHELLERENAHLEAMVEARTREIEVYSEEVARSNRELEDFAFVASHDLQEPLRKIQAFSNRLQSLYAEELDERAVDYMARMNNAATRMSSLIEDLLEFSRIRTRAKPFENVQLNELFDEVLEDIEIAIAESDAGIRVAELPEIYCDPTQISRVFHNLLTNAIKFRKQDSELVINIDYEKVTEADRYSNQSVEWHKITFSDNGIGFDQKFADKIFSPFQRLHGRDQYKGTGIGLAICRRIIERHGGEVSAKSVEGEGAEFTLLLPIDPIDTTENSIN